MKINKNINHKQLWLVSMTGMSMGFFSTLIVGTLIGIFGLYSKDNIFVNASHIVSLLTPFAIGVGIGFKAHQSPLQILAIGLSCAVVARSMLITKMLNGHIVLNDIKVNIDFVNFKSSGDVLAAWISGVFMLYFLEVFKWETNFDFLIVPFIGIMLGIFQALWLTYIVSFITVIFEFVIYQTVNKDAAAAIGLAPVVGALMGLALTLPISSAAMAIALHLHGDAALAAVVGTSAQMLSFGVMTYWATGSVAKTLAVGLGTSMLHIHNYARKPIILVIPTIVSALCALVAVATFHGTLPFAQGTPTSGMGSAVLYGQIFTMNENGWGAKESWLTTIFFEIILGIIITLPLLYLADQKKIIRKEYLQLWNNTQPNTLQKQAQ